MNIEKVINEPSKKEFKGKKIKKALVASMLALTLATPSASQSLKTSDAASKPTVKMYGQKNVTTYTGDSIKLGKVVGKYKGKKLAKKKLKVTVKKESISYPAIANKIKNNKPVTFNSTGTYDVKYKFTSPAKTTKTATRQITVLSDSNANTNTNTNNNTTSKDFSIKNCERLSKYGTAKTVTYDGISYDVIDNSENISDEFYKLHDETDYMSDDVIIDFSKYAVTDIAGDNIFDNYSFFSYLGKVTIIDDYGKDCSDSIFYSYRVIPYEKDKAFCQMYFIDSKKVIYAANPIIIYNNFDKYANNIDNCHIINNENEKIGIAYVKGSSFKKTSYKNDNKIKKLVKED